MGYILDTPNKLQRFKDLLNTVKEKYDAEPLALHTSEISVYFEPETTEEDLDLILQDLDTECEPFYLPDSDGMRVGRAWFSNNVWADLVLDDYHVGYWEIKTIPSVPSLPTFNKFGEITNDEESM